MSLLIVRVNFKYFKYYWVFSNHPQNVNICLHTLLDSNKFVPAMWYKYPGSKTLLIIEDKNGSRSFLSIMSHNSEHFVNIMPFSSGI